MVKKVLLILFLNTKNFAGYFYQFFVKNSD